MTGITHRQYSVTGAFIAAIAIYELGLSEINYYLTLPTLIFLSRYGAMFPDFDHSWRNVSNKTTPTWIINKVIHMTGGKHRAWQTHSWDICIVACLVGWYLPIELLERGIVNEVNFEMMRIIVFGFLSGWISHLLSDMMTSAGVYISCIYRRKIAFVPKKLFGFRFNTGNEWESFNFTVIKALNQVFGVICVIYPLIDTYLKGLMTYIMK